MQEYVLGFAFTPQDAKGNFKVALIEKLKPDWQRGKLNGVGGKVELDETPRAAIEREFEEETGVYIPYWDYIGKMFGGDSWVVHVYTTTQSDVENVTTKEKERVILVDPIKDARYIYEKSISNVPWLLHSCLDVDYLTTRCLLNVRYGG